MGFGLLLWFAAVAAAQTSARLAVITPALHQYDGGPALPARSWFHAGEHVFVTFQISGYKKGEEDQVKLSYTIDAADSTGRKLEPAHSGKVAVELAQEDKNWTPKIRHSVLVPPTAPSGACLFFVRVRDEIAGVEASADIPFQVRGVDLEPAETLTVARVRFYRREEDSTPQIGRAHV